MNSILKPENIKTLLLEIRDQKVILDSDVAKIYGVETKRVNEAVKNNPDKFPAGYIFELNKDEWKVLKSKISTLKPSGRGHHSKYIPTAFTEKGLYMLATILKSKRAVEATIAIIETFAKVRELTKAVKELSNNPEKEKQKSLMQKSGEIISELLDDDLETTESETTIELNFAVLKFKHVVKKNK